jgi:endonuclease YncB( thermonuclease family)
MRRNLVLLAYVGHDVSQLVGWAPAQAKDLDCADFASQGQAQAHFVSLGGPQADPDRLDGDGDGRACDTLPCPCGVAQPQPLVGPTPTAPLHREHGRVLSVVDGDTVDVRLSTGQQVRVRLLGIDTPEVYGGVQCGAREASAAMKQLLPRRARVSMVSDRSQDAVDRYGRILRYVAHRGHDVGRLLVRRGHARVYVYQHRRFERLGAYDRAERSARGHDRGLWGHCR